MIIGFIVLGIFIIAAVALFLICKQKRIQEFGTLVLGIVAIGIVLGCITMAISDGAAKKRADTELVEVETIDIYSLNLSSSVSGSFTLGSGSVKSNFVYIFYVKDDQDFYSLHYVDTKVSSLKETNEIRPCIVRYKKRYAKKNYLTMFGETWFGNDVYVIYVPEGTMVEVYNAAG